MNNYVNVYALLLSTAVIIASVCGLPTSEESQKTGKNLTPIMQTLLSDMAKELMTRSTPNNQVLTMSITNLLILLLLKGLLWGASYAGSAVGYQKGRLDDSIEPLITETEILLLLSYLMGDNDKNFECLHRVACEDPSKTREYVNMGQMIMHTIKFMGVNYIDYKKYEKMLNQLQEVLQFKQNGGSCETKYFCNKDSNNEVR